MKKKFKKAIKSKYTITLIAAIAWLLFLDKNDVSSQIQLTNKLNELESEKKYYLDEINKNKEDMLELKSNPISLEKFAREKYLMKKENEEIFVITGDSTLTL